MNHASLFSGIGGFDLASKWMGWNNIFAVEKDIDCRKVLSKNFPDVNLYEDIKEFKGEKYAGAIDIISGGFPCQGFSFAGKRKGKEDDRYLWPEMLRVIREIKPTYVLGENVPGIISLALDTVLTDLENEGYACQTFIIPACAVNAIHRRDRVWILAYSESNRYGRRTSDERPAIGERELLQGEQAGSKVGSKIARRSGIGTFTNTSSDGSQNGRETQQRTHGSGKEGRMFESQREDIFSEYTERDGRSATEKPRSPREAVQKSSIWADDSLNTQRTSSVPRTKNNVSDSNFIGIRRYQREGTQEGTASRSSSSPNDHKQNGGGYRRLTYPISEPTICRGDDGVSYRLDDGRLITPKQRTNSLKQLGNSVVPQLVYEIFRMIDKWNHQK
jgi:DNA (cytosine-5)-methyltransferase 1